MYYEKYIKYKNKYLFLKSQLGSGEKSAKDIFIKAYARIPDEVSRILNNDKRFLTFIDIPTELDSIFNQIFTLTGKDKNTIDWVTKSYVNNTFGVPSSLENLGRFKDSMKKYNLLKKKIEGFKPISEINGLVELEGLLHNYEDNFKEIEKGIDDKEIILETDKVFIYKPTTEDGARYYGRKTRWCTASDHEHNQFDYYNKEGNLYIIQSKSNNNDKYQLHIEKEQFMDSKDEAAKIFDIKIHFNDDILNEWFTSIFKKFIIIHYNGDSMFRLSELHYLPNLESLILDIEIRSSLGNSLDKLTNLKNLVFGYNCNPPLGNSLDKLTNLQTLNFGRGYNQPLGNSLDNLINLNVLYLSGAMDLPLLGNSLDKLTNLEYLYLGNYKLKNLGDSLDKLINLRVLIFGDRFDGKLGNYLDKLTNLKTLDFSRSSFNQPLGNSLDKLTNLKSLNFGNSEFNQPLGNSLDKLTNLQYLNLGEEFNELLGNSLDKLTKLEVLNIHNYNKPFGNSLDKLTKLIVINDKPYLKNYNFF